MELNIVLTDTTLQEYYLKYTEDGFNKQEDSGIDLFCPEDIEILPGETVSIDFKIKCCLNHGSLNYPYFIFPRSSISKKPIRLANCLGIIDKGYRGTLKGMFDNIKTEPYTVKKGERIIQLCAPNLCPIEKVNIVDKLDDTLRGEKGFGSSGN